MAIYSYSKLGTYEQCPRKYKLLNIDRVPVAEEKTIEVFLGNAVHKTLQQLYEDQMRCKYDTIDEVLQNYFRYWDENWCEDIKVNRQDLTPQNYRDMGVRMLQNYYHRHAPFDMDITIGTEYPVRFALDEHNRYFIVGKIDRIARTRDNIIEIHDYKTSGNLPAQEELDNDRQMGLYHLAVQQKWPPLQKVRLIWHYLAFDMVMVSSRTTEALRQLTYDTISLIHKIETDTKFEPRESPLCKWCACIAYCPNHKHINKVEALPINEFLTETGVELANRFAKLKQQVKKLNEEIESTRLKIIDYARREDVSKIKGSDCIVTVRIDRKLVFPNKSDAEREKLDSIIKQYNKWEEVSQLDTSALKEKIENKEWHEDLLQKVMQYIHEDEDISVRVHQLTEEAE